MILLGHAEGRRFFPGKADASRLNKGDRPGTAWIPAECDVSIRPGWFYHAAEDDRVKTPQKLLQLYYDSVGNGASLLLNLPPDKRGQIPEKDAQSLREFHQLLEATFQNDLARQATVTASNWRGNDPRFAPSNVSDGRRDTYWATDDNVTAAEITLAFEKPVAFNVVRLRKFIPLGRALTPLRSMRGRGKMGGICQRRRHRPLSVGPFFHGANG